MQMKDKVAVVLGASAEGGTGWGVAEALAAEGAKVVVAARRREPLEALAGKISGTAVVCDAADPEQIAALARAAQEAYGPVDLAVNSAALPAMGMIADAPLKRVRASLDVNYIGHVCFVREMAAVMRDGGAITLISTAAASQPTAGFFPYACAKAATDALVRYAALEYGPRKIRVNAILPGTIATGQAKAFLAAPGMEKLVTDGIPLRRVGVPEDYAEAALWLAGDAFVTGLSLDVSGGAQLGRFPRAAERAALGADTDNL